MAHLMAVHAVYININDLCPVAHDGEECKSLSHLSYRMLRPCHPERSQ